MDLYGHSEPVDADTRVDDYGLRRLTAHIRDRFHAVHRRELADAIILARRVEQEHAADPACPKGLADHLQKMLALIDTHQRKEEMVIFPALLAGRYHALARPLQQMAIEHAAIDRLRLGLVEQLDRSQPGADAGVRWRLLHTLGRKIDADLREHARLEDEILYPRCAEFASAQRWGPEAGLEAPHEASSSRVSQG